MTPSETKRLCEAVTGLPGLRVRGLMAIPPAAPTPEDTRPHFRALRELRDGLGLEHLSMGMSADYEVAIEEGATMVRVGTAIFGPRQPPGEGLDGEHQGQEGRLPGRGEHGRGHHQGLLQTGLVPASSIAATDARADRLEPDRQAVRHPRAPRPTGRWWRRRTW